MASSNQTERFGLKPDTIAKINDVFARHQQIQCAILYGSRAKSTYRHSSDIDLTLVAPDLCLTDLFRIEQQLDDLLLPYQIDLSLLHQIQDTSLLDHIHRCGVVFYNPRCDELPR